MSFSSAPSTPQTSQLTELLVGIRQRMAAVSGSLPWLMRLPPISGVINLSGPGNIFSTIQAILPVICVHYFDPSLLSTTPVSTFPSNYTVQSWMDKAGFSSGFRRKTDPSGWASPGPIQTGDILGPWIWEDLTAGMAALTHTINANEMTSGLGDMWWDAWLADIGPLWDEGHTGENTKVTPPQTIDDVASTFWSGMLTAFAAPATPSSDYRSGYTLPYEFAWVRENLGYVSYGNYGYLYSTVANTRGLIISASDNWGKWPASVDNASSAQAAGVACPSVQIWEFSEAYSGGTYFSSIGFEPNKYNPGNTVSGAWPDPHSGGPVANVPSAYQGSGSNPMVSCSDLSAYPGNGTSKLYGSISTRARVVVAWSFTN